MTDSEKSDTFAFSLKLSKANMRQNGRCVKPLQSAIAATNMTLSPELKRQRKRTRYNDIVKSLETSIPIPKFDFELKQLERAFFDNDDNCKEKSKAVEKEVASKQLTVNEAASVKNAEESHNSTTNNDSVGETTEVASRRQQQQLQQASSQNATTPSLESPRPLQTHLLAAIEAFLNKSDPHTATVNHCFRALEKQFAITLQKKEKSWIRQQSKEILQRQQQSSIYNVVSEKTSMAQYIEPIFKRSLAEQQQADESLSSSLDSKMESSVDNPRQQNPAKEQRTLDSSCASSVSLPTALLDAPRLLAADNQPDESAALVAALKQDSSQQSTTISQMQEPSEIAATTSSKSSSKQDSDLGFSRVVMSDQTQQQQQTFPSHEKDPDSSLPPAVSKKTQKAAQAETVVLRNGDDSSQDSVLLLPNPLASANKAPSIKAKTSKQTSKQPTRKPVAKRGPKGPSARCPLCIHCPCTFACLFESNTSTTANAAKSDDALERSLMRQLQTMEKNAEKYEDQIDTLRRRLKKHRKDMWIKFMKEELEEKDEKTDANPQKQSRFLPNTTDMNALLEKGRPSNRQSAATVAKAKRKMFSFAPNYQPTLTQMLGGSTNNEKASPLNDDNVRLEGIPEGEEENTDASDEERTLNPDDAPELDDLSHSSSQQTHDEGKDHADDLDVSNVPTEVVRVENGRCVDDGQEYGGIFDPTANGYICKWDALFDESSANAELEQLCDLFDGVDADRSSQTPVDEDTPLDRADPSLLSQRGRGIMDDIIEKVSSDSAKVMALEASCPEWKENVCFALQNHDSGDLHDALQAIQSAKMTLQRKKAAIMEAAARRANALELFELALQRSIARLQPSTEDGVDAQT
ncbi:hypothetical protein MPSEU_001051200 [Mayamaea pseudoterrestris]|nr:hypothetical protein MPSEU_001051200 [Mayamaea pseudoterrestris]